MCQARARREERKSGKHKRDESSAAEKLEIEKRERYVVVFVQEEGEHWERKGECLCRSI